MAVFKTAYDKKERFITESGLPDKAIYEYKHTKDGKVLVLAPEREPVYEKIQVSLESCKITNIMERAINGDTRGLRPEGNYIDVTEMPKNLMEAQQAILEARNYFMTLDEETRAKFNNSADVFINAYGSQPWAETLGFMSTEPDAAAPEDPAHIYVDDTNRTGSNGSNYITDAELGGELLPVAKFHDYFTSALPDTQFGPGVTIPIGGTAPVYTAENEIDIKQLLEDGKLSVLKWQRRNGGGTSTTAASSGYRAIMTDSPTPSSTGHYTTYINNNATISSSNADFIIPSNLWADLGETNSINIAALRRAFSIQQWQEALARGGNRYHEIIRSIFNTISPDARQQMPEYLGGFRMPINVTSVLQTSSTDATTPQGNEAGYSITTTQPAGNTCLPTVQRNIAAYIYSDV
ncbi:unnamed protein product [Cylicocyclus nassatus]|uniref:Uncharacterized protein n=1 Tax=Cylicocyclus nassatus TaxID=53992 RepID=A0AA36MFF0_CYLNA|nr:unnamed protein product [Cylicocyclus nassatus]